MKSHLGSQAALVLVLSASQAFAQSWDPIKKATGWAHVDKDGSVAFYDPASKMIHSWMKDGGIFGTVDVSKLEQPPEKWLIDFSSNAWIVSGKNLIYIEKSGKSFTQKLPYEVSDLTWDVRGFYLSYKTPEPYVEMRGYDSGSVVWYVPGRAVKSEPSPTALYRIAVNEDKTLYIGERSGLQLDPVNASNGRVQSRTTFSHNGGAPPALTPGAQDRGRMAWWVNKNTIVQAVPASQVPTLKQTGLLLAVQNLSSSTLEFVTTGLSEQHSFIGMIESEAVFIVPGGGLAFVPIQTGP